MSMSLVIVISWYCQFDKRRLSSEINKVFCYQKIRRAKVITLSNKSLRHHRYQLLIVSDLQFISFYFSPLSVGYLKLTRETTKFWIQSYWLQLDPYLALHIHLWCDHLRIQLKYTSPLRYTTCVETCPAIIDSIIAVVMATTTSIIFVVISLSSFIRRLLFF